MRKAPLVPACLLLAACQPQDTPDAPTVRAMRDDLGGRLFYIESRDKHNDKRSTLILSCHGDGDNVVMFKTQAPLSSSPSSSPVFFDYRAGSTKGRAETNWLSQDVWTFRNSALSRSFAKLFLQTAEVSIRFPGQTGAPHSATWSRSTAADLENQLIGWCLKPKGNSVSG